VRPDSVRSLSIGVSAGWTIIDFRGEFIRLLSAGTNKSKIFIGPTPPRVTRPECAPAAPFSTAAELAQRHPHYPLQTLTSLVLFFVFLSIRSDLGPYPNHAPFPPYCTTCHHPRRTYWKRQCTSRAQMAQASDPICQDHECAPISIPFDNAFQTCPRRTLTIHPRYDFASALASMIPPDTSPFETLVQRFAAFRSPQHTHAASRLNSTS
jgi:hypothetical protein